MLLYVPALSTSHGPYAKSAPLGACPVGAALASLIRLGRSCIALELGAHLIKSLLFLIPSGFAEMTIFGAKKRRHIHF